MKIQNIFLTLALGTFALSGCQSYPKNPSKPSIFDGYVEVNKTLPVELDGVRYELVQYPTKQNKSAIKQSD
ncbi:hypothetical protein I6L27_19745 (plasmid) [Acinetobacter pittii]|uniref:hypothetical protein n=1 Tax=Acinetobacter TaxID=469 RepID=UPI001C2166B9|nr:hypothetical protein [Acinetobacter pittii]QXA10030.1 hypothetical protein I6L27_19745 [Acinetobacter pittii]